MKRFLLAALAATAIANAASAQSLPPVSGGVAPHEPEKVTSEYFVQERKDASLACQKALEGQATYGFRGTGWFGFIRPDRGNQWKRPDDHLLFGGDDAEVQDKFANWIRVNYKCEWDPATKQVVKAEFHLGLLPK